MGIGIDRAAAPADALGTLDRILPWFVVVLTLWRGYFLTQSPVGLIGDESYYWDWSRHPAWCYYSKPPMVAWIIGLSTSLLGDTESAVRAPVIVLGAGFLWFFHATAQAIYGRRAAFLAVLLICATPHSVLANLLMTIDPPLFCFWMMALYFLQRALFEQADWAWLWAGCATALGLLSKQVAVLLPIMLLVFLLLDPGRRRWLRREYWLYLLPVAASMAPILWWNGEHDWIMWSHSKNHFTAQASLPALLEFKYVKNLLFHQLLLISPLIFGLVLFLSWRNLRRFGQLNPQAQFLMLTGPVLLIGVLLLSFLQKVQGNWPMPFYFSSLILLAGAWDQGLWRKWLRSTLLLGYAMVFITYSLPSVINALHWQDTANDPIRRFRYWRQVVADVQRAREHIVPDARSALLIVVDHRDMVSELAFYLPDQPQVYHYSDEGIASQYEIWPGPETHVHANAILINNSMVPLPEAVVKAFTKVWFVNEIANPRKSQYPYHLYYAEDLRQWPELKRSVKLEE